jgi:glycerol kinase
MGCARGGTGLRAGVFDLSGQPLAFAATTYPTQYPKPGWAEQEPQDWWEVCAPVAPTRVPDRVWRLRRQTGDEPRFQLSSI